ncbi:Uncharacterised protein [uncultured archaeon]|nr:Uncharacterised protein [uncultured archaeon]
MRLGFKNTLHQDNNQDSFHKKNVFLKLYLATDDAIYKSLNRAAEKFESNSGAKRETTATIPFAILASIELNRIVQQINHSMEYFVYSVEIAAVVALSYLFRQRVAKTFKSMVDSEAKSANTKGFTDYFISKTRLPVLAGGALTYLVARIFENNNMALCGIVLAGVALALYLVSSNTGAYEKFKDAVKEFLNKATAVFAKPVPLKIKSSE